MLVFFICHNNSNNKIFCVASPVFHTGIPIAIERKKTHFIHAIASLCVWIDVHHSLIVYSIFIAFHIFFHWWNSLCLSRTEAVLIIICTSDHQNLSFAYVSFYQRTRIFEVEWQFKFISIENESFYTIHVVWCWHKGFW